VSYGIALIGSSRASGRQRYGRTVNARRWLIQVSGAGVRIVIAVIKNGARTASSAAYSTVLPMLQGFQTPSPPSDPPR
jgi:hypothetical protein